MVVGAVRSACRGGSVDLPGYQILTKSWPMARDGNRVGHIIDHDHPAERLNRTKPKPTRGASVCPADPQV